MHRNATVVSTSVDFRVTVMRMSHNGQGVYAQWGEREGSVYRIIGGNGAEPAFTMDDLFGRPFPPVRMEDLADALHEAIQDGEPAYLEIFNL